MKILVLNPQLQPGHSLLLSLQKKGVGILLPANSREAWQMLQLHGVSVSLALVHRESAPGQGGRDAEEGLTFVSKVKQDRNQKELPIILTTQNWDDAQCATHQDSPNGVHAYLKAPFTDLQVLELIDGVMGSDLATPTKFMGRPGAPPTSIPETQTTAIPSAEPPTAELTLSIEVVTSHFPGAPAPETSGFSFDPPDFALDAPEDSAPRSLPKPAPAAKPDAGEVTTMLSAPEVESPTQFGEINLDPAADTAEEIFPTVQFALPPSELPPLDVIGTEATRVESMDSFEAALESPGHSESSDSEESLIATQMPYLSTKPRMSFAPSLGDAVVPGGAAHSPDFDTLKKYLLLREQDVTALAGQLKSARDQVTSLDQQLAMERARSGELSHLAEEQKRKIDDFEREKVIAYETSQAELADIRFQMKQRTDKARLLEAQIREATEETEKLKERVRVDIRKIRVREKDLENRLELMKKDSEALLGARENKIIELKRKLDLLEFNMDLLQDQYSREKQVSATLRDRLSKAAQVVRVAGGLLSSSGQSSGSTTEGMEEVSTDASSGNSAHEVA
ncbi:MAG: hypothetical protein H7222_04820 [Methylotenera sp.]|nr:hypothetical protein [Oligoflexia bacterium]